MICYGFFLAILVLIRVCIVVSVRCVDDLLLLLFPLRCMIRLPHLRPDRTRQDRTRPERNDWIGPKLRISKAAGPDHRHSLDPGDLRLKLSAPVSARRSGFCFALERLFVVKIVVFHTACVVRLISVFPTTCL